MTEVGREWKPRRLRDRLRVFARRVIGERVEVTDETIDGLDLMAVIRPAWFGVSIYDGPARYEADLARFSREQRHLLACLWYEAEVNNGGHHQFFWNDTGIVWRDALDGFRRAGLPDVAQVIADAAFRLGGSPSLDRSERQEQLDGVENDLDDLDDRFFALEQELGLDGKLREFVRANRAAFRFSGRIWTR